MPFTVAEFFVPLTVAIFLSDVVHLKGNNPCVDKEMLSSSIFVASSIYEGFSLVIVEAMACGLPVVSYSCPYGPREIIHEGNNGFLVPVNDEKLLAERICRLIADEELRRRMGAAAFEHAKDYAMETILQKWLSLFRELLNEKLPFEKDSRCKVIHKPNWGQRSAQNAGQNHNK